MAKFYKHTNLQAPGYKKLPSVIWDKDSAIVEFTPCGPDLMSFETHDPALISRLTKMGYEREADLDQEEDSEVKPPKAPTKGK